MAEPTDEYELTAEDRFIPSVAELTAGPVSSWERLRAAAPFLLSLIVHLSVLIGMAICSKALRDERVPTMLVVSPPVAEVELKSFTIDKDRDSTETSSQVFQAVPSDSVADAGSESMASPLAVVASNKAKRIREASPLSQVNGLFGGLGLGQSLAGSRQGVGEQAGEEGEKGAEFFGVHAAGTRFVFVVDSSRSMRGRKWATACRELIESVGRLHGQQSFYVIFFDVDTHPMFDQRRPERDLLPVNAANQKRLKRWLPSIKLGADTRPLHAMQLALRFEPDAIFLLSDGEFADPTRNFLLAENIRESEDGSRETVVPIHTVGFHSLAAQAVLQPIAHENGGVYRFIPGPRR